MQESQGRKDNVQDRPPWVEFNVLAPTPWTVCQYCIRKSVILRIKISLVLGTENLDSLLSTEHLDSQSPVSLASCPSSPVGFM